MSTSPGDTAFLFAYFIGNGEDGLHLAASTDGYAWETLGGSVRVWLEPAVGESKLMRDPFLLRGPDATFHLLWTTAWEGVTIGYASSRDLIHWSEQRALPVMADQPGTRNSWAPEAIWDATAGHFVIFWSSTVVGRFPETADVSESGYNHRLYCTTTSDFVTFTPTRLFWDPGFSVIDAAFLTAEDGALYLIVKDETLKPEPRKHLRIARAAGPQGPFTDLSPPFTEDWVEGPAALRLPDGTYAVYFDCYREKCYGALRLRNLADIANRDTWEDISARVSLPRDARHGSVLAVESTIIEALKNV